MNRYVTADGHAHYLSVRYILASVAVTFGLRPGFMWRCSCGESASGFTTDSEAQNAMAAHGDLVDFAEIDPTEVTDEAFEGLAELLDTTPTDTEGSES